MSYLLFKTYYNEFIMTQLITYHFNCYFIGMSTVPEVIIACHCGIKVLAVSLIANNSILDAENDVSINHEKVLAVAAKRADLLQMWFKKIITRVSLD